MIAHKFRSSKRLSNQQYCASCPPSTSGQPYFVEFMHKNPTRCNSVSKFITPYLHEALHVSGNTPPIIGSLKLH